MRGPLDKTLLCSVALVALASLSGCAGSAPFDAPIDKSSPAASHVADLSAAPGPYPRWSQFPAAPKDVPAPSDFALRAAAAQGLQGEQLAGAQALAWTLSDTEAFAAAARRQIDPSLAEPAPSDAAARTAAFVEAQRALAAPPPKAR